MLRFVSPPCGSPPQHHNKVLSLSLKNSCFPNNLKSAEVSPIVKKDNNLEKENYRPVSNLPYVSKDTQVNNFM